MARDYKKVVAWQRAHELTLTVIQHTKGFPNEERFGLTSQVRRASSSVPANIAEGAGRETDKDYLRFLITSRASLMEAEYLIMLSRDLHYLDQANYTGLSDLVDRTARPLSGLIKVVGKQTGFVGRLQANLSAFVLIVLARFVT